MELRFICQDCGTKWFVPDNLRADALAACEACGGPVEPFALSEPPAVFGDEGTAEARSA